MDCGGNSGSGQYATAISASTPISHNLPRRSFRLVHDVLCAIRNTQEIHHLLLPAHGMSQARQCKPEARRVSRRKCPRSLSHPLHSLAFLMGYQDDEISILLVKGVAFLSINCVKCHSVLWHSIFRGSPSIFSA